MKVFIVYCHPSEQSFSRQIRDAFIKGITDSGNEYIISDLYKMNFWTDLSEEEYTRESEYRDTDPVPADVLAEQEKIAQSDAIAFVYPIFWSEAPAKLVGWFDRVWTYGFAYGDTKTMKPLLKAQFLCSAGNSIEHLNQYGIIESMKHVMIGDRFFNRAEQFDFHIFERMVKSDAAFRDEHREPFLQDAYRIGATFFQSGQ
jgi:NAD(P)H dehydrogenase (quinone)